jgi:hypothetical protein
METWLNKQLNPLKYSDEYEIMQSPHKEHQGVAILINIK